MKFSQPCEMHKTLMSDIDLYSPELEVYLCRYDEMNSIAVFTEVSYAQAHLLNRLVSQNKDSFWGQFLGANKQVFHPVEYVADGFGDYSPQETHEIDAVLEGYYNLADWFDTKCFDEITAEHEQLLAAGESPHNFDFKESEV